MKNKKEKQIVAITAIATIVLVSSFTIMQGTIKNKEDKYISRDTQTQLDTEISKDSYEIIKNESLNKENEYVVLQKKKLSSQELALLTNEITKE
ncbi:MAG: hypothetical protein ACRCXT_04770, partial [Paraclostridium sp.]